MKIIPIMSAAMTDHQAGGATPVTEDAARGAAIDGDRPWHDIGLYDSVFGAQDCHGTTLEGIKVGVFRVAGDLFALDDICTHGAALLSDGFLEGHEVECPLHAGLVDVRTGKPCSSPITRAARCHDVRVEDGRIYVRINP